jgi:hypothetical protein
MFFPLIITGNSTIWSSGPHLGTNQLLLKLQGTALETCARDLYHLPRMRSWGQACTLRAPYQMGYIAKLFPLLNRLIRFYAATVIAPYWEPTTALMQMFFWRKSLKMETVPVWDSLRWDAKIEKFDTKTKFKKQTNGSVRCMSLRSIEWY